MMTKTTYRIFWAALAVANLGLAAGMGIEGHKWLAVAFIAVAVGFSYHALRKEQRTLNH
jgi:hypothetical protein